MGISIHNVKLVTLMIGFWVLKVQAGCPSTCNCTATSVSCVAHELETVPNLDSLESSPVIVDFSGNQLLFVTVTDFDFPKSNEVKEIYLNNSGITDIGEGTFDNVENLQELYLGQNFLTEDSVPQNVIEHLNSMVLLDMSSNYFENRIPSIRSNSLEVLALVNSKISSMPENALQHLPNLKLLLLQQNNLQFISFEPFKNYAPSVFFVKLAFNPWTCSCENLRAFNVLSGKKYLDTSEPYQCVEGDNKIVNIFNKAGGIDLIAQECDNRATNDVQASLIGYQEIRDMVVNEERKNLTNLNPQNDDDDYVNDDTAELDIKRMNDADQEAVLPGNCWEVFTGAFVNDRFFTAVVITTVISFFIGFMAGLICCKVVYTCRYKKLEQSSDSQVQLLGA